MKKQCYNKRNQEYLNGHRHSFVGFFTAGYPDTERFFSVIQKVQECGMGIFEIGFPAKDPYADGELIRKSHKMIDHRISNERKFWEKLRETTDHPIWLMGYKEDLIDTGIYLELAKAQVVDALVIPILPVGERIRLMNELKEYGVDMLGFIGNQMEWENNDIVCEKFPIIYQQLYSGPTGCVNNTDSYKRLFHFVKKSSNGYVFAGFGIGTEERAAELLKDGFDGVIIGTAIMKKMNVSEEELMDFLKKMEKTVEEVD